MSRISVAEAADRLGVNVQRVHQRIADGSLAAERVGRQWTIDEADVARLGHRRAGRPLSPWSAWTLARVAAADASQPPSPSAKTQLAPSDRVPDDPVAVSPAERSRARARIRRLLAEVNQPLLGDEESAAEELAASVRSLLRSRARRRLFRASSRDLPDLRLDARVQLSGISLPASGIASGDIVEGYVHDSQLKSLVCDYLLMEAGHDDANVVLHVVDLAALRGREVAPDSWLLLAADLAEYHRPREMARAVQIVRKVAEQTRSFSAARSG